MTACRPCNAFVSFPDAEYTASLIRGALSKLGSNVTITSTVPEDTDGLTVQWSTYDDINHELTLKNPRNVLSGCYIIRKSLIRKHFLHRALQGYMAKHPNSILGTAVPHTWDIEINHLDELDELWVDDLYDLVELLSEENNDWFILKPGMADRGMGIRLFKSKAGLQEIFESFEESDGDEEIEKEDESKTGVVTSQLRHFVIQAYLQNPLLIDPKETVDRNKPIPSKDLKGRKFHLRAYCVAQGALKVYLFPRILALFSSTPYSPPSEKDEGSETLSAHLTNTALQDSHGEENVRLLQELVGCRLVSCVNSNDKEGEETLDSPILTQNHVDEIIDQVSLTIGEVFEAGLNSGVHFQTLPNAFELFGADLLVTHENKPDGSPAFRVNILELNAEPAIHLTGPRLGWILEELFDGMAKTCVLPFINNAADQGEGRKDVEVGETRNGLRCCLTVLVRSAGGW